MCGCHERAAVAFIDSMPEGKRLAYTRCRKYLIYWLNQFPLFPISKSLPTVTVDPAKASWKQFLFAPVFVGWILVLCVL